MPSRRSGQAAGSMRIPGAPSSTSAARCAWCAASNVFARVLNLFDREYEEVLGYPVARPHRVCRSPRCCAPMTSRSLMTGRSPAATSMTGGTSRTLVLDRVSTELAAGSIVGILGPNGSGKTTLLRLLSGTRTPTAGEVLLDGTPLRRLSRRDVARRIAVVPQETQLAFDYTVHRDGADGPPSAPRTFRARGARAISRSRVMRCARPAPRSSKRGSSTR